MNKKLIRDINIYIIFSLITITIVSLFGAMQSDYGIYNFHTLVYYGLSIIQLNYNAQGYLIINAKLIIGVIISLLPIAAMVVYMIKRTIKEKKVLFRLLVMAFYIYCLCIFIYNYLSILYNGHDIEIGLVIDLRYCILGLFLLTAIIEIIHYGKQKDNINNFFVCLVRSLIIYLIFEFINELALKITLIKKNIAVEIIIQWTIFIALFFIKIILLQMTVQYFVKKQSKLNVSLSLKRIKIMSLILIIGYFLGSIAKMIGIFVGQINLLGFLFKDIYNFIIPIIIYVLAYIGEQKSSFTQKNITLAEIDKKQVNYTDNSVAVNYQFLEKNYLDIRQRDKL